MNDDTRALQVDESFRDLELSAEARIACLVGQLTLKEKVACLGTDPSVPRLGLRGSRHVEGLHGLAQGGPGRWGKPEPVPTTIFPQSIGLACSWQPELLERAAALEASEARYYFHAPAYQRGGLVVRAPNADLGRDPRWGRNEECFGEDATLVSRMVVAFVRGLQGGHHRYWQTAALLKHFLANSNEDGREHTSSDFDERQLHEYYLAPFRAGIVEGGARAFMTAYNAVNGVPCTYHPLVKDVAVGVWGQDGIVCTDAHAASFLVSEHKTCRDMAEAVTRAVAGGITQFLDDYVGGAEAALASGQLSEADLDQALTATFRVMLRLGLLDPAGLVPYAERATEAGPPHEQASARALCREVTQQSIVLLKNSAGLLPLTREPRADGKKLRLCLVGPLLDRVHLDWYAGTPPYLVTPLAGIREKVGDQVELACVTNNDLSAAMAAAKRADACLVFVGSHPTGDDQWAKCTRASYGKESVDRKSLELEEEWLVERMFEANPNTVLVLISSFPYAINWSAEHLPAIVHSSHSSQELGHALADVLFGDVNPAGRLVQTWPKSIEHLPPILDYDLTKGRTYMYFAHEPLYAFGFGLSYSHFAYEKLSVSRSELALGEVVEVGFELINTGERDGDEVAQLYVSYPESALTRPKRQLIDFKRVRLGRGERQRVTLELRADQLCHWDAGAQSFALERTRLLLHVGKSSQEIVLEASLRVV